MNLGKGIKLARTMRDLTQSELSRRSGIDHSYISLLERDKRDPTLSTVIGLATALDVPLIILIFLAANDEDLAGLDAVLQEKLSNTALQLLRRQHHAM